MIPSKNDAGQRTDNFFMDPELKTLKWWISRLMLKLLVLLNPRLFQYAFDIQERSLKFNQSAFHVKMYSLTLKNRFFFWR